MKPKILIAFFGAALICNSFNSGAQNTPYGSNAIHTIALGTCTGTDNSAFGGYSLYSNLAGANNTAIGKNSLYSNTNGSRNTAAGRGALTYNTTASDNSAFGYYSLRNNTTGLQNSAFGVNALYNNLSGFVNSAFGSYSLYNNKDGFYNSALGDYALYSNTGGAYNTATGYRALYFSNDSKEGGGYNTADGSASLYSNTTGYYNTAVGGKALYGNVTGSNNTAVGYGANVSAGGLINATAIGSGTVVQQSNTMKLGNQGVLGWGFGVDVNLPANHALDLGVLGSGTQGNGAYCTQGGTWVNTSSKNFKEDFTKQDAQTILGKINALTITKWKYKGTNEYHIGPVAEDFYNAFAVGLDDKSISTVDPAGIALIGIQALSKSEDENNAKIDALQKQNSDLEKRIEKLEAYFFAQSSKTTFITDASIEQNVPNPFNNKTSIRYHIPQAFKTAQIVITDFSGKIIKQVAISTAGLGTLNVDASLLSNGGYSYSLIVDGRIIDSKKMVHAK